VSTRAEKSQAEGAQGEKQKQDAGYSPGQVQIKLHNSWAQYVKGLGGGEQQKAGAEDQKAGAGAQNAEGGYTTGDNTTPQTQNPEAKTVHDGKDYTPNYKKFEDPVFKGAPKHTDANQGYLADCFLVAAMAAVAQQRPDLIQQMIEDHGDGTVTVTMYKVGGGWGLPGQGAPVKVRISNELPTTDGARPAYARGADKQLWPALIEKAYVAINGGGKYQGVNAGGSAGDALQAILGQPSGSFATSSKPAKQLVADLEKLHGAGKPLCAGSLGKDEYQKDASLADLADKKKVFPWHAYVIVKADGTAGTVELYNPWGSRHPDKLTGEEFQKLYKWVYQGNPPAPKA
jgi:hypothetical protein